MYLCLTTKHGQRYIRKQKTVCPRKETFYAEALCGQRLNNAADVFGNNGDGRLEATLQQSGR